MPFSSENRHAGAVLNIGKVNATVVKKHPVSGRRRIFDLKRPKHSNVVAASYFKQMRREIHIRFFLSLTLSYVKNYFRASVRRTEKRFYNRYPNLGMLRLIDTDVPVNPVKQSIFIHGWQNSRCPSPARLAFGIGCRSRPARWK